ncbi:hypothetical protein QTP88_009125 [Uroleucon formosanum]
MFDCYSFTLLCNGTQKYSYIHCCRLCRVTCPGVWICPKGMIYLDIWLFGCNSNTSCVEPKFPLAFNETFNFHKTFKELSNLRDIQKVLEEKCMKIELVQAYKNKQVTLASYSSYVDEVLYPERSRLSKNGETALLMKNEPLFPGTISPKITLVTKTSVTEQINVISRVNDLCSPQYLETQNQPNRMRRVHHSKFENSQCSHNTKIRTNEDENINSDTDTDSQLYCLGGKKTNNNMTDWECHSKKSCQLCEHMNRPKINEHRKESSDQKLIKESLNLKDKSLDNDEYKKMETTSNKFGKNVKATFKVGVHHYKCCKSKLNNSSSTNESIKTSDEDCMIDEGKNTKIPVMLKDSGEEPKKINPKIKACLHLDVYRCKCGMPDCIYLLNYLDLFSESFWVNRPHIFLYKNCSLSAGRNNDDSVFNPARVGLRKQKRAEKSRPVRHRRHRSLMKHEGGRVDSKIITCCVLLIDINNNSVKHRRNICNEVNRRDTIGDAIKYHISLRNYYKRLYDGATYQLEGSKVYTIVLLYQLNIL